MWTVAQTVRSFAVFLKDDVNRGLNINMDFILKLKECNNLDRSSDHLCNGSKLHLFMTVFGVCMVAIYRPHLVHSYQGK